MRNEDILSAKKQKSNLVLLVLVLLFLPRLQVPSGRFYMLKELIIMSENFILL
jgi:hypothetical protein